MTRLQPFDVDAFLTQPLVARVATDGPSVRPVWFLWEDGAFWWLTHTRNRLVRHVAQNPQVALVVDTCDLSTGQVLRVLARGPAVVLPLDEARAWRTLRKYLGPDVDTWDPRFVASTFGNPGTRMIRMIPTALRARDHSFRVQRVAAGGSANRTVK